MTTFIPLAEVLALKVPRGWQATVLPPNWELRTAGCGGTVQQTFRPVNGRDVLATEKEAEHLYGLWRDGFRGGFQGWTAVTFARNYFQCTGPYPYAGRDWEHCGCPGDRELRDYVRKAGLWPAQDQR